MRKIGLLFLILVVLVGCKNDDNTVINPVMQNKALVLKIDYETFVLEGGRELVFETNKNFDVAAEYVAASDFGGITLLYKDTEEMIFSGSIIWNGTGEINFPENFIKASDLQKISNPVEMPDVSIFKNVMYGESAFYPDTIDYQKLWNQINTLTVLKEYRSSNPMAKIHLLLYTPIVGILDLSMADWIVIVKN